MKLIILIIDIVFIFVGFIFWKKNEKMFGFISFAFSMIFTIIVAFAPNQLSLPNSQKTTQTKTSSKLQETTNDNTNIVKESSIISQAKNDITVDKIEEKTLKIDKIEIEKHHDKITEEGESIKYEFVAETSGTYRFEFSDVPNNSIRFYIELYNSDMEKLEHIKNSYSNGGGITDNLTENEKYYVVVEQAQNTGSFTLNIGKQKPVSKITDFTKISDYIEFTNQKNIYSMMVAETGTYRFGFSDIPNSNIRFYIKLYNSDMEELETDAYSSMSNGGGITYDNFKANSQYYIIVEQANNVGPYTLNVGKQKSCIDVTNYSQITDCIEFTDQINIYKFQTSDKKVYNFELINVPKNAEYKFFIYNSDMIEIKNDYIYPNNPIPNDLKPNSTYYIAIGNCSYRGEYGMGEYTLTFS